VKIARVKEHKETRTKGSSPLLSLLVPAYNAERTLARAITSLRSQTYRNLEIWIINDGSTDATGAIAEAFARQDARVHVLHQRNRRAYLARLTALKVLRGAFFAFIDADDWVEPETYAKTLAFMHAHQLDVAAFDIAGRPTSPVKEELFLTPQALYTGVVEPQLVKGLPLPYLWNKVYRSHVSTAEITALNLLTFEDMALNLHFFRQVKRVGFLHQPFYHYEITSASSVSNFSSQKLEDFILAMRFRVMALAKWYGIAREATVHRDWIIRNARVALVLIATAPKLRWEERLTLAQRLLALPELTHAMTTARGLSAGLLRAARRMPQMTFLLLRPLRWIWQHLPMRLRLKA
jgi:glycosyltransferase involved in cell wall biosynthesis